jgi:hypothetical protein
VAVEFLSRLVEMWETYMKEFYELVNEGVRRSHPHGTEGERCPVCGAALIREESHGTTRTRDETSGGSTEVPLV